jgi:hypothetical protein
MKNKLVNELVISLLLDFSRKLEKVSKDKLSISEHNEHQFVWEFTNKTFSVLVSLENFIRCKDSLAAHLMCRFTYEMLVTFAYVVSDREKRQERISDFLSFNQFKTEKRQWSSLGITGMVNELKNSERFSNHSHHYKNLSNFAHPTNDLFMLNRRGEESEFMMIQNSVLLSLATLVIMFEICEDPKTSFLQRKTLD